MSTSPILILSAMVISFSSLFLFDNADTFALSSPFWLSFDIDYHELLLSLAAPSAGFFCSSALASCLWFPAGYGGAGAVSFTLCTL